MQDLNDKVTNDSLTAAEWNEVPSEIQNAIEDLGITLSGGDLAQLAKAIVGYASAGTFYSDSGVADAYVLGSIGSKEGIVALDAAHDGALCRFRPAANSTGASTINVNGLGAKTLTREDGSAIQAGDLATTRDAFVRYDQSADVFRLLDFSLTGPLNPTTYAIQESTSNTEATVEGALTDSIVVPATGNYVIEVEAEIHAKVEAVNAIGHFGDVTAHLTEDTGGGPAVVRSSNLQVRKGAAGNDDTEIEGVIVVKHRFVASNSTTYTYAVALDLTINGTGIANLNALDGADGDTSVSVKRIHSFAMKMIQTS